MHTHTTASPRRHHDTGGRALTDDNLHAIIDGAVRDERASGGITFLRQRECQRRLGSGRSRYYMSMRAGEITPPIADGRMALRPAYEVAAVQAVRVAGGTTADVRRAVELLVEARPRIAGLTAGADAPRAA